MVEGAASATAVSPSATCVGAASSRFIAISPEEEEEYEMMPSSVPAATRAISGSPPAASVAAAAVPEQSAEEEREELLLGLMRGGMPASGAAKDVASALGISKKEVYSQAVRLWERLQKEKKRLEAGL